MDLLKQKAYRKMLQDLISSFPHWGKLEGKDILISGASGMIGSLLIDTLMQHNEDLIPAKQCRIVAVSRSAEVARQYTAEPINTILANLLGTKNMLDIAMKTPGSRFLLLSSVEVYGENRGDADYFTESYCGYIDCNTLRAGYSEAKRVSEAMCQAYIREKDVDAVIIRLPRCYGPTMRMADTKALSQFIKKGLSGEDIVLKSEGKQFYSYAFAADVVLGMLYALNSGACGEAYNLADGRSDIALRELAALVAEIAGSKVVYELPSEAEQIGYSTATRAVMRGDKLNTLGWCPHYDIETGIKLTMRMLRDGI